MNNNELSSTSISTSSTSDDDVLSYKTEDEDDKDDLDNEVMKDIMKEVEEKKEVEENKEVVEKQVEVEEKEGRRLFDTLVLPGGGIKGILILGALQYCYDNNLMIEVDNFVGTSSGAMISFLLVIGYTPVEIITNICSSQVMEKMQHFDIFAMINNLGASSFGNISNHLERMTIDKIGYLPTFADLKLKFNKNFVCVTYNLTKSSSEYLCYETTPTMPCMVALRMTSNLPLVFENYKYDNNYYIDGGIVDNFSLDYAENIGMRILGLYKRTQKTTFQPTDNILEFIFKLIYIPIKQQQEHVIEKMDKEKTRVVFLDDDNKSILFNFHINTVEKLDMFSSGYRQCQMEMEKV
jgi:predicted patatin/cPLA2 family phospholipase